MRIRRYSVCLSASTDLFADAKACERLSALLFSWPAATASVRKRMPRKYCSFDGTYLKRYRPEIPAAAAPTMRYKTTVRVNEAPLVRPATFVGLVPDSDSGMCRGESYPQ